MKAYQVVEPAGIDGIREITLDEPVAGAGEVKVQVKAASLNYRDFGIAEGGYYRNDVRPIIPLSDAAGEVVEIGKDVTRVAIGDRVCPMFVRDWVSGPIAEKYLQSCLGGAVDGVLREYVVYPEHAFVRIPDTWSYTQAATLPCAALTAWNALFELGNVRENDVVLLLGTGGVSTFAFQLASAAGARVIMTSSSDEKLDALKAIGLKESINYTTHPDWHEVVRTLTGGCGADYILEVGGPGTLERSLKAARVGGHVQLIGLLDSPRAKIAPMVTVFNALTIQGIYVGSREMFERMLSFMVEKAIFPIVDREFTFKQSLDAYRYFKKQEHLGKVVITF